MPKYSLYFDGQFWEDLRYWIENDYKTALKILDLINEIEITPFSGIGKPEPLKHDFKGCWSRRIDHKNRLVYQVEDLQIVLMQARYHY